MVDDPHPHVVAAAERGAENAVIDVTRDRLGPRVRWCVEGRECHSRVMLKARELPNEVQALRAQMEQYGWTFAPDDDPHH